MGQTAKGIGLIAVSLVIGVVVIVVALTTLLTQPASGSPCVPNGGVTLAPVLIRVTKTELKIGGVKLKLSQIRMAQYIMGVASVKGEKTRYAKLGLMTSYQETKFTNYPVGSTDADSGGIFAQQPDQGWGTPQQVMNPVYASNKFFEAVDRIPGRAHMTLEAIALAVQRPRAGAYDQPSNNFNNWGPIADALLKYYRPHNGGVSPQTISADNGCAVGGVPNSRVEMAVQIALSQIGIRYTYGGCSRSVGFDCSCLVQYAFGKVGIDLPRTAAEQFAYPKGVHVTRRQLERGDLVFWANSSGFVEHVAIYLGENQIVVAPHTGAKVETETLWMSSGGLHFVGGLRLAAPDSVVPTSRLHWQLPVPSEVVSQTYMAEQGVDFVAPRDTPVVSSSDGTVTVVRTNGLLGTYVRVKDKKGEVFTYAHLHRFRKGVKPGASVKSGEIIAEVGDSGSGIGDRLLFTVQNKSGHYVDPIQFLRAHGVRP